MKRALRKLVEWIYPDVLHSHKSYAQDGEDMLLKAFFEGKKGYKGFYVDIGAHHPTRFSNTAYFYNKGWRGINIEPTPSLIYAFKRNRKRDINLNIGIYDEQTTMTFYEFNEPALNSFDKEQSLLCDNNARNNYKIISTKEIDVYPLKQILSEYLPPHQKIDFMNIDVEGLDFKVLLSNDWSKFKPDYLLVECKFDAESISSDKIYNFLKNKNYQLIGRTKRTSLYKRANC